MNQKRQRLCSGGALMKIRSLSAERVCRHNGLRAKPRFADWALKFDLL
jgi:hypothetical protein